VSVRIDRSGDTWRKKRGQELLFSGTVGTLILAGGAGSRLGFLGPKGTFIVTPFSKKSLFQLALERVRAASIQSGCELPVAILTSPLNREETANFLEEHDYFGLLRDQVTLFEQKMLPLLDEEGKPILLPSGLIAEGADGNGYVCREFVLSGVCEAWRERGIEYVTLIPIDNILADPFDVELCGYHDLMGNEITVKAIEALDPEERVGRLLEQNGKLDVVEYSELSCAQKNELLYAYSGLLCFSLSFIAKTVNIELPVHIACKQMFGKTAYKRERFIFDLLKYATSSALLYSREEVFAPIKELSDLTSSLELLFAFNRRIFYQVTGVVPPREAFELDAAFYYPTEAFLREWKDKSVPHDKVIIRGKIE